jgi:tRNA modification GTPase
MKNHVLTDTICALATPPGTGAIAVIRVSGPDTYQICSRFFRPVNPLFSFSRAGTGTIHRGIIEKDDDILDEVLLFLFKAPHSYTGEDVVEISCHGSGYIQHEILSLLTSRGCCLAKPGEFTLRAFLNGKYDLSQAEAVADLIACHSRSAHDLAVSQMRGGFSKVIRDLRSKLVEFTSLIELELDFSEEDVEFASRPQLFLLIDSLRTELQKLIHSFRLGNVIRKGIPVAITGKPNVGKSTLLNALLNEERAIVSEIPGTTRDTIEDTIVIGGYSFRFIDTAGLRVAEDAIESIGVERTWEKIHQASIILYIFDASADSFETVNEAIGEFGRLIEEQKKRLILIGNKTDLLDTLPKGFREFVDHETIFVSAKRKENIHLIAESLLGKVKMENIADHTLISNARHLDSLQQALAAIETVHEGLHTGITPDLLTIDIRKALHHLGEITGEITTEEILSNIFGKFCIGK